MICSQLLVTENNDNNSHSQTQDYCPNDVPDNHVIMMQPDNQNADAQNYHNHALSGIGTFTQCKLCDMYCFNVRCQEQFHIAIFDIAGDAPASKPNDGMTRFNSILSH